MSAVGASAVGVSAVGAVLQAQDVVVLLGGQKRWLRRQLPPVQAVAGVSMCLLPGETLGLVGESGCGKTTLGRALLGIQRETSGEIRLDGRVVSALSPMEARVQRRAIQYVHQDAGAALDPWWRIGHLLEEGLIVHGVGAHGKRQDKIDHMLAAVGLDQSCKPRYIHELSGGQLRRVVLARILLLEPRIVILDEPTSGLDLSVRAAVLRLLADLKARLGLTYLLISHDLSVVERVCDRIAIMYLGRIVETGPAHAVFRDPRHPYTQALLAAAPRLELGRPMGVGIKGEPPNPRKLPSGCAFRTRCPHVTAACAAVVPALQTTSTGHEVACARWREIAAMSATPSVSTTSRQASS
jgi:peptide/nickel transport system ATP-binding protein